MEVGEHGRLVADVVVSVLSVGEVGRGQVCSTHITFQLISAAANNAKYSP